MARQRFADAWVDGKWTDPNGDRWAIWTMKGGHVEIWCCGDLVHAGCWTRQEAITWVAANWNRAEPPPSWDDEVTPAVK